MHNALLYPLFSLILLHFLVAFRLLYFRIRQRGFKDMSEYVTTRESSTSSHFKNLYEVPILFYVALLVSLHFTLNSFLLLSLFWGYVAARYAHSLISCTSNYIPLRFACFQISMFALGTIWIVLGLKLL